jgi:hypothetical protein
VGAVAGHAVELERAVRDRERPRETPEVGDLAPRELGEAAVGEPWRGLVRTAAVDGLESVHATAVDRPVLRLRLMVRLRDDVGRGPQWDRRAVGELSLGDAVTGARVDAKASEDVVEAVVLLIDDHHVLDRVGRRRRLGVQVVQLRVAVGRPVVDAAAAVRSREEEAPAVRGRVSEGVLGQHVPDGVAADLPYGDAVVELRARAAPGADAPGPTRTAERVPAPRFPAIPARDGDLELGERPDPGCRVTGLSPDPDRVDELAAGAVAPRGPGDVPVGGTPGGIEPDVARPVANRPVVGEGRSGEDEQRDGRPQHDP